MASNLTTSIEAAINGIDRKLSQQLAKVIRSPEFSKIEGAWRGINLLVRESEVGTDLKIKVCDLNKDELKEQFDNAPAVDRSPLFSSVYQHEFGTAGGEPYAIMVGDYFFTNKDEDIELLRSMGELAAASHCPFISSATPEMFELDSFQFFNKGRPVAPGFDSPSYASWNGFRTSEDARYICLTMPRVMSRLPYGEDTLPIKPFSFEELEADSEGYYHLTPDTDFVWSNSAYNLALCMTTAFFESGWCTAIRGLENGGKVESLPNFTYKSPSGDTKQQCPCEVNITDEREKELTDLGFLSLVHYKNQNYGVFIGSQTTQKPKEYTDPSATANAAISARLPYVMASSRIAHYLKVIGRDRIGSNLEADDLQVELTQWIAQYTNANALGNEERARFPLRESKIQVVEQVGKPGSYSVIAYLRPWLQLEELSASLRTVATIPSGGS